MKQEGCQWTNIVKSQLTKAFALTVGCLLGSSETDGELEGLPEGSELIDGEADG